MVAQLNDVFFPTKPVTFAFRNSDETSVTTHPAPHDEETANCHNCGAAVSYHYCALCGQETTLHVPSASEFIHEFVGHYIALEGKLWTTVRKLLLRPGFLSAEYIAGRRVRYVQPLRVYLTFSILFFFVLKLAGTPVGKVDEQAATGEPMVTIQQADPGTPELMILRAVPAPLQQKLKAFNARPAAEQSKLLGAAFFAYVPYAMFILMPLFAAYLKLLYAGSGRRYGEHLLFALHTNAFAFAMFSLILFPERRLARLCAGRLAHRLPAAGNAARLRRLARQDVCPLGGAGAAALAEHSGRHLRIVRNRRHGIALALAGKPSTGLYCSCIQHCCPRPWLAEATDMG